MMHFEGSEQSESEYSRREGGGGRKRRKGGIPLGGIGFKVLKKGVKCKME